MKKLKIVIFTDSFIPLTNGIVTSTINLVKGLADKGHKIYIIAPKQKFSKEFYYKNVFIIREVSIPALFYPGFRLTFPFNLKLLRFLKHKKIDLIHFQTPVTLGIQAILIAKILKKPLIGTFHTFVTKEEYIKHLKINPKLLLKFSWSLMKKYYNKCDLITCPSESTKKELIKYFSKPIKVISNGINLSYFNNLKRKKTKLKYNLNNKTILYVGRIAYEKNLEYLIDCFKLVLKKIHDAKLLIIGEGPQMKQLKKYIKSLGISKNIIFTGKIKHEELLKSEIFKRCKIFVTTSKTETQGITILEAEANGMVCVGLNASGTKDLIKNNYNGYLIKDGNKKEFAKKIITLITNNKIYNKMSKNTLLEIKKHDLKKVINEWEKTYLEVIHETKKF